MSDSHRPDEAPDPIDAAYARAEAMLSDDAPRAARRERVLAAVARDVASPPTARRRPPRYGVWLAAACVVGLSLVVVTQTRSPFAPRPATPTVAPPPPASTPAAPTPTVNAPEGATTGAPVAAVPAPAPAKVTPIAPPAPSQRRLTVMPAPPASVAAPAAQQALAEPRDEIPAPRPPPLPPPPPSPPPPPTEQADRRAFAASSAPPAGVVTTERTAPTRGADASGYAEDGLAGGMQDQANSAGRAATVAPPDRGAALREAAAGGQAAEVEALLGQGTPVDAADAAGETALMKSILAGHPAVAALLVRHGASLDRRNHAGQSARDLAARRGDAALNQALGLSP